MQTMISRAVCILLVGLCSLSLTEGSSQQDADVTPHDPACGEREIFLEIGVIKILESPGWPQSYPLNTSCNWLIRAPVGQVIRFTVDTFSTESFWDKLQVFDVEVSETLAQFSGIINRRKSFTSKNNHVTAKFHSDSTFVERGFSIDLMALDENERDVTTPAPAIAPCGFNEEATSEWQTLFSPGWPGSYGSNLDCQWEIRSSSNSSIILNVFRLNTERCCDYLSVMDGDTEITRLKGKHGQNKYTAHSGVLRLHFHSDESISGTGFRSSYFTETPAISNETTALRDPACGQWKTFIEVGAIETLQSPGWPQRYRSNASCNWLIRAPDGHVIRFMVDTFSTESCCDKLQLFDVEANETLAELSGSINRGVSFITRSNHVTVKFLSDLTFVDRGFSINLMALNENQRDVTTPAPSVAPFGFHSKVTNEWQTLSSPGWPHSYGNNLDCQWEIRSSSNTPISLNVSRFNTESCCDYLSIMDGDNEIARLSGIQGQKVYTANSGVLKLLFHSDESVSRTGFESFYIAETPAVSNETSALPDMPEIFDKTLATSISDTTFTATGGESSTDGYSCGNAPMSSESNTGPYCGEREMFTEVGAMKTLQSPGWPQSYRSNTSCNWLIRAPVGHVIRFTVDTFSTESCCDKLQLSDAEANETLAKLSGNINRGVSFTSRTNHVTAKFHSDSIFMDRGFLIDFTALDEDERDVTTPAPAIAPCGFSREAAGEWQMLSSPGWPGSYSNNLDCQWVIRSSVDMPISLNVSRFNTESCCDYLSIMDGDNEIARLSGIQGQKVYTANSGVLKLLFHSDESVSRIGFESSYSGTTAVSGATLPFFGSET